MDEFPNNRWTLQSKRLKKEMDILYSETQKLNEQTAIGSITQLSSFMEFIKDSEKPCVYS